MDKRTRQDSFDKEYTDSLNKLYRENSGLTGFKWFLDTAHRWAYRPVEHDVVILGAAVPEELVIASGAEPHWFIGGSLGSTEWSDELVPRDTREQINFRVYQQTRNRLFGCNVYHSSYKRQHEKNSLYTKIGRKKNFYCGYSAGQER